MGFYFDHNAATPVSAEALAAFTAAARDVFGNPSRDRKSTRLNSSH